MQKSIIHLLVLACTIVVFVVAGGAWRVAGADDSHHRDREDTKPRGELVITEVHVIHADPANDSADTINITVKGANLDDAESVTVLLGADVELVVLSVEGNKIVALCPILGVLCNEGDYRLTVVVEKRRRHGKRTRLRVATYDLTVGAVGPQGEKGDKGDPGEQGEPGVSGYQRLSCGTITVPNPTPNGVGAESVTCPCPAGKVAVAGGVADLRFPITVRNSRDFNIAALHPTNDIQWRVRWFNGTGSAVNVTLYTVCVNAN